MVRRLVPVGVQPKQGDLIWNSGRDRFLHGSLDKVQPLLGITGIEEESPHQIDVEGRRVEQVGPCWLSLTDRVLPLDDSRRLEVRDIEVGGLSHAFKGVVEKDV